MIISLGFYIYNTTFYCSLNTENFIVFLGSSSPTPSTYLEIFSNNLHLFPKYPIGTENAILTTFIPVTLSNMDKIYHARSEEDIFVKCF